MCVRLESYRPLVVQEAWKVWTRLPQQTQNWLGLEDLVAMGMSFAWATKAGKYGRHRQWRPHGGASFGHYLKNYLFRFYDSQVVEPYVQARQRNDGRTVSIEQLQYTALARGQREGFQIENCMRSCGQQVPTVDCLLVEAMLKLYEAASEDLRRHIVVWFLQTDHHKLRTDGRHFARLRREFRWLAGEYRLTIDDCRHFMHSPVCLDQLSRKALWLPFDLNHPTPEFRQ